MHTPNGSVDTSEPMLERDAERSVGGLWRDVLNFLGDRPVSPDLYLPLADAVLPRWAKWTYFLGHAAASLTHDRAELDADVARARVGWRIWSEQREDLRTYVQKVVRRRVDDELLEEWWIFDAGGELWAADISTHGGGDKKRAEDFRRRLRLTEEDEQILRYHPDMPEQYLDYWLLTWLRWNLRWVDDLEMVRRLGRKTWPADPRERQTWTPGELQFINWYFEEQQPYIISSDEEAIDPFELEVSNGEQGIGFGMDGLRYVMYVFLRAIVIDFVDEILERTRRPTARGSLSCIECGRFVGRRALGYGQLYCSDRCKKRAAKRRYRSRTQVLAEKGLVEDAANTLEIPARTVAGRTIA
jgi:predicted nucleic acid-binding Zn ribbon protein